MKTNRKKIALQKETLRALTAAEVEGVRGGTWTSGGDATTLTFINCGGSVGGISKTVDTTVGKKISTVL